jgi:hypothetical protein
MGLDSTRARKKNIHISKAQHLAHRAKRLLFNYYQLKHGTVVISNDPTNHIRAAKLG